MSKVCKEFKSGCGCEIHIIRWSSKRDIASVKHCPLHKTASELLDACHHAILLLSGISTDGEITMTPEGKDKITAELRYVIAKAEGRS